MKLFLGLLPLWWASLSGAVYVNATQACHAPDKVTYPPAFREELEYFCRLPERVQRNFPEMYWYSPSDYQAWLQTLPKSPAAPANFGSSAKDGNDIVDRLVLEPDSCHFYSSISPSVQGNRVNLVDPRTFIVLDAADLLAKCEGLAAYLASRRLPPCSVVEFAGHSIQAASLDTVFGVEASLRAYPSEGYLGQLGHCFRRISQPKAYAVFSTCGGDTDASGISRYWPGKEKAQQQLSHLFQMPILSGVGPVSGTTEGGVLSEEGWHLSR